MHVRLASASDLPRLLPLVRAFWAFERLPLHEVDVAQVLSALFAEPTLGRVLLLERDGELLGYSVLTFGFSVEHGGRDALVDELFVVPEARSGGGGTLLLEAVAETCRGLGVRRVHLEVDHTNPRARALYARLGFRGQDRQVLTWRL